MRLDGPDERLAIADLGHDSAAGLLDQARDALADQRRVLGDHDAERLVGHPQIMHRAIPPRLGS